MERHPRLWSSSQVQGHSYSQYYSYCILIICVTTFLVTRETETKPIVVTENDGLLFLPPAFRFLKYCKTTEHKCIEQNTLELWSDLKRHYAWRKNFPQSSLWWTSNHPKLTEWLDSEYNRLRGYYVDDGWEVCRNEMKINENRARATK